MPAGIEADQRLLTGRRDLHLPRGDWRYLYRAVDSTGATIDFWFFAERDVVAAKRFFQKALQAPDHPRPRVITVDGKPSYPKVITELKRERKTGAPMRLVNLPVFKQLAMSYSAGRG
jgi:transposase-like protein